MPKGTFKQYLLYEMFTHEKAGFPQTNEESPPFFVYRIKSRFSVKRRNPNPSPTWKIKFGFLSFGPSGESRTHGLLNPILCDEWYGRTHRQKSAETSHFQCFLFPRFWYDIVRVIHYAFITAAGWRNRAVLLDTSYAMESGTASLLQRL